VLKNLKGVIEDDTYLSTKLLLENQKNDHLATRRSLSSFSDQLTIYLGYGFSLIGKLSHYYQQAQLSTKKKMIGSIFLKESSSRIIVIEPQKLMP
jgi:hypothetical protein